LVPTVDLFRPLRKLSFARRVAYLAATGILVALGVLTGAPAALAHATLVATSPAEGAIVARAPARVSATFDEPVGVSANSLQVFAPNGSRVDTGATAHGSTPQEITVALKPGLGRGTYTVGWHVISADSHPVQGAFTFSVGAPSTTAVNPATLGPPGSLLVGIAFGLVRWLAFCCFALLIGAVAFVIWCWPAGAGRPAVLRLAMGAWGGLALSVLAAVLLQGVYGAGQGVGHVFLPDVLHATLYSRYGRALGVRLLLVIAALLVFTITLGSLRAEGRRARVSAGVAWGVLTAALASTWAVADHAGTGIQVPLAVPSDVVHLSAVAIWLGGLVMIATILLRSPRAPGSRLAGGAVKRRGQAATVEAARAVARFSPIALGCVVAIVATGTYQAWRGVGTLDALTGTTYGRLLIVKIAAMCVLIALGYLARRRIAEGLRAPVDTIAISAAGAIPAGKIKASIGARPRHHQADQAEGPGRDGTDSGAQPASGHVAVTLAKLRWSVAAEVVIAVTVLAVTAVLVNTPTARETFTQPATATVAFDTGGPGGRGSIGLTVTPARLGSNQIRVSITDSAGRPYRPQQVQAALLLPARNLGPLTVRLVPDGRGHYLGGPVTFTITGQWQLRITIRSDKFDEITVAVPVSVH
jgi:copper transport protein